MSLTTLGDTTCVGEFDVSILSFDVSIVACETSDVESARSETSKIVVREGLVDDTELTAGLTSQTENLTGGHLHLVRKGRQTEAAH